MLDTSVQPSRVVWKNLLLQKKVARVNMRIYPEMVSLNELFCHLWFSPHGTGACVAGLSCKFGTVCMVLRFLVLVQSKAGISPQHFKARRCGAGPKTLK